MRSCMQGLRQNTQPQTPIPGLELGPLLGKGSFGRVYRGKYKGNNVAVKVRPVASSHFSLWHLLQHAAVRIAAMLHRCLRSSIRLTCLQPAPRAICCACCSTWDETVCSNDMHRLQSRCLHPNPETLQTTTAACRCAWAR